MHEAHGQIDGLERLIETARHRYRSFADTLQKRFMAALKTEGWPVAGFPEVQAG